MSPVTVTGLFREPDLERTFRVDRRGADDTLTRTLVVFVLVCQLAFALVDRELQLSSSTFTTLLLGRLGIAALGVVVLLVLRRASIATVDRMLVAWFVAILPFQFWAALTRPSAVGPLGSTTLLAVLAMILLPIPLRSGAGLAAAGCGSHLVARLVRDGAHGAFIPSTVLVLAIAWAGAVLVAATLRRSRRFEYLALREQRGLRQELEAAMAEIRTLRGIVSICAFCKDVRDEDGTWQRVEVYVRDRTHASFSHGFCPSCVEKHYGDEDAAS